MSTTGVDGFSIPDPAEYTYPSGSLPQAIEATPTSTTTNPYVAEYNYLQQYDAQELFAVSFGSAQAATANVDGVLAQWVGLQMQEQEQQQQAIQAASAAAGSSTTGDASNVPSLDSIISQSDSEANSVLTNYASAPAGSSIIDYQA